MNIKQEIKNKISKLFPTTIVDDVYEERSFIFEQGTLFGIELASEWQDINKTIPYIPKVGTYPILIYNIEQDNYYIRRITDYDNENSIKLKITQYNTNLWRYIEQNSIFECYN